MATHPGTSAPPARAPLGVRCDYPGGIDTTVASAEVGVLEDPWQESPEEIYALTRSPRDCP